MAEYCIHLRPERSDVPEIIRLRRALKILLRSCQLRAIDVKEIPAVAQGERSGIAGDDDAAEAVNVALRANGGRERAGKQP